MKATLNKIFSVLLAVCFVLSAIPAPAAAAEIPTNEVTNGSYNADGVWTKGDNGSVTYTVNGHPLTLSKTAEKVGENKFDITLTVETESQTITHTQSGAVVLVIDLSNSMARCANCGADPNGFWWGEIHEENCNYNGYVQSGQSRLAAAKVAAKAFLASYAGSDASASRQLAIVGFGTNYSTVLGWTNVAGGSGSGYSSAIAAIDSLPINGGTNMEGGLLGAYNLIKNASADQKSVVLLSDGAPTYGETAYGDGSSGSSALNNAVTSQASAVKGTGADLYTVCYGAENEKTYYNGPTVGNFLRDNVATSGCAYNAGNTTALNDAFKAIVTEITDGMDGKGLEVIDPMADMIDVVIPGSGFTSSDDDTYIWTLGEEHKHEPVGDTTHHIYSHTYTVTLDVKHPDFVEGDFFPTNDPTYLTINNTRYYFPVPGVKGVLPRADVIVTKVWDDADNQDKVRPKSVQIQLYANDGAYGDPVTVTGNGNTWTYTFEDLKTIENGKEIKYTAREINLPNEYNATYSEDGLTITNTHEVYKTSVTVTKKWDDNNNQDGIRPTEITVQLLANGEPTNYTATMTGTGNEWTYTFTGLDKNANGKAIEYTVAEVEVPKDYSSDAEGLTVTNTHAPEKTSVEVKKVWNDNNDQDGKRPDSITVQLYANDVAIREPVELEGTGNEWTYTFTQLDKYADGEEITYTVKEVTEVPGYEKSEDGLTITNTHTPEKISIPMNKIWEDNFNQDGKRPVSITVNLKANGKVVATATVTGDSVDPMWRHTFENVDKFADGKEIDYSVEEVNVDPNYTAKNLTPYSICNFHTPEKTSVSVTKVWNDNDDQDGIRPKNITVYLMNGENKVAEATFSGTGNTWTYEFTNVDKFENGGDEIVYTVKEIDVPDDYKSDVNGLTITNTYVPKTTSVTVIKEWEHKDNEEDKLPEEVTVRLMANGVEQKEIKLNAENKWTYTFENLPENAGGKPISYTVTEDTVTDYTNDIEKDENGNFIITNTYDPAKISITFTKAWEDANNQDGKRPDKIKVELLADGKKVKTIELTAKDEWTTKIDIKKMSGGKDIVYTIKEVAVEGYTSVITGDQNKGFTITNTHEPEMIDKIVGQKIWDDGNNQDGKRPESITVKLKANGDVIKTVTVTAENNWLYTFENLPKFDNGEEIAYTVEEAAVEGYKTSYDGYKITNTYSPEEINIKVTKSWVDSNDADKIRPTKVTIYLLANGEKTGDKLVLTAGEKWTGSFTDLPKYKDGKVIKYTIEEKEVKDYKASIKGSAEDGFTVTNSHTTIPKTGDERTPILWISMMALGIIAVFFATRPFFVKKGKYSR